ncbi:GRIP and coiled-coil domain-containing protein C27D7.02c isoform X3 [Cannabis sativa]|uniref:GRIP and coiled-coil domain-containing protein C27D7.02c isoform X3 n=1 Tax=Cannabis sativa TaxID=3483 RepID=UPI0029CA889C|nr:GRIP and coiled-coil domain-containing protein C27D7.02c isoform X3 [Cannabis sativa]
MEDYLHYMKTLRSQMNDVEDQAAKVSVEEQTQLTTLHTFENDLSYAKSQVDQFNKDNEAMLKTKGEICSKILENHRKISSLESDSSTLSQTLELIQQERISVSAKLTEKRTYYLKVAEDINARLQDQMVMDNLDKQMHKSEGEYSSINLLKADHLENSSTKSSNAKLESVKAKLAEITEIKLKLVMENKKMEQAIDLVNCRAIDCQPELRAMDIKTLEEEHNALLSDKAGETEYLKSLREQVEKLKGISLVAKCSCGEEYRVQTDLSA